MSAEHLAREIAPGVSLFDAGRWFEAHEAWEEHWLSSDDPRDRLFLQGLIQLAGALHKGLVMGHASGMASLAHQAAQKLAHVSLSCSGLGGLDLPSAARLAHEVEEAASAWARSGGEYKGPRPSLSNAALVAGGCGGDCSGCSCA